MLGAVDAVRSILLAIGFGRLAVLLTTGRFYWWFEAPWLGWLAASCRRTQGENCEPLKQRSSQGPI
ncbi:hypothetical protein J2X35_000466 [Mesorhizobium sp. BE184]|nr:hypothetical protein [Mesorhizobium sp. BE184]